MQAKQHFVSGSIIIILDDGGLAIKQAPHELLGQCKFYRIEQTTSGLRFQNDKDYFPIIQVATSAAKVYLEPNFISRALVRKLHSYLKTHPPKSIGVVGFGHIGKAVAHFFGKKYEVYVFDIKSDVLTSNIGRLKICNSIDELIYKCDMIIGATGVDISNVDCELLAKENKTSISVSSNDIEFNHLLKKHSDYLSLIYRDVLQNIEIKLNNGSILKLIRGGTVANFNNGIASCRKNQIQLTRALLFPAVLQALNNNIQLKSENAAISLKSEYQNLIVEYWFKLYPNYLKLYPIGLKNRFQSLDWINENSGMNKVNIHVPKQK